MNSSVGLLEHKIRLTNALKSTCRTVTENMDQTMLERALEDVLRELEMPEGSAKVETAMGAPEGEAVQVGFTDESTGGKAVAVSLRDADGRQLDEEGLKQRLREQLSTFRKIDEM